MYCQNTLGLYTIRFERAKVHSNSIETSVTIDKIRSRNVLGNGVSDRAREDVSLRVTKGKRTPRYENNYQNRSERHRYFLLIRESFRIDYRVGIQCAVRSAFVLYFSSSLLLFPSKANASHSLALEKNVVAYAKSGLFCAKNQCSIVFSVSLSSFFTAFAIFFVNLRLYRECSRPLSLPTRLVDHF